ncbi:putative metalloprotease CJM1_0395 family protein [Shewanella psychrotolerans]|uniref:putative metalloprotease CJM1_0395 family protein n=1 Tax=Shewanella psychrotolerans TaxID=2864206 RepID=UPI001C65AAE1|nr:putative metalloprotease CJM1_0395 family protein [Shewanella psychrotolerans]QYJ99942.1 hypothetical protein K0I62_10820 [Shewanella psychrotolerans]
MSGVISTPTNTAMHVNAAPFALSNSNASSSRSSAISHASAGHSGISHSGVSPQQTAEVTNTSVVNAATLNASASFAAFSKPAASLNITSSSSTTSPSNNIPVKNNRASSASTIPTTVVVQANTPSRSYSLSLGALELSGMINSTASNVSPQGDNSSQIRAIFSPSTTINEVNNVSGTNDTPQNPPIFTDENAPESAANAAFVEPEQASKEQAYSPFEQEETSETQNREQQKQQQKAEDLAEQVKLEQLSKRDAEVRAHEQAHANVGGNYARSPSLTYELGSDGKRYAVDGEVSIDIAAVPNDPLATLNKMKRVYAAAMAPVNPSMADIRVASEALRKMNEAKGQLAAERVQQAPSVQEIKPLIDADNASKGIVIPEPVISQVFGEVNENGVISGKRTDSPSVIDNDKSPSQTIERLSRYILASNHSTDSAYGGYQSKVIDNQYLNTTSEKRSSQLDFSV